MAYDSAIVINRAKIGLGAIAECWLVEFMSGVLRESRGVFLFDWRGVVFADLVWRGEFRNRCGTGFRKYGNTGISVFLADAFF